ncbi:relaxase/mobilization nuclease domain-containing protein [Cryptobacterium curtum]|uniref:relaxase/mobilization nuclease domain-containing protein n=1 Tax=Cryptobacterium curtum TaxID=84163 RepID=UPI00248D668D|nr:relaxase/mobilization nuclease domain-containing protein [Cryptobacterium curtum]
MPYVKFIAGHTGTGVIRGYLQRNGRALAVDYLNLDAPALQGNLGELPVYRDFDWSAAMDRTRRYYGTDSGWGGKRARTFKHYIFSPDPSDDLDIQSLRRLATAWAKRCFPDHEVAIVYHDDNAANVLHAHVVVNNVNLATGKRL